MNTFIIVNLTVLDVFLLLLILGSIQTYRKKKETKKKVADVAENMEKRLQECCVRLKKVYNDAEEFNDSLHNDK